MSLKSTAFHLILIGLTMLAVSACTRPDPNSSKIRMILPQHPDLSKEAANQILGKSTPQFCYFVNVVGPGLPAADLSCLPKLGILSAYGEPGSVIELQVNTGDARVFELYAYLTTEGANCADLPQPVDLIKERIYAMGKSDPIKISGAETIVTLTSSFPGVRNHIVKTNSYAASCLSANPLPISQTDFNGGPLKGDNFMMTGQIQVGANPGISTGSQFKIRGALSYEK